MSNFRLLSIKQYIFDNKIQNEPAGPTITAKTSFFLDGVSGVGKSTVLKKLTDLGKSVVYGDYYDHSTRLPEFESIHLKPSMFSLYNFFLLSRVKEGAYHDRSPIANFLFDLIWRATEDKGMTLPDILSECTSLFNSIERFFPIDKNWCVQVFLTNNEEKTMANCKQRKNNIDDDAPLDYFIIQNLVFLEFAKFFKYQYIFVDEFINLEDVRKFNIVEETKKNFEQDTDGDNILRSLLNEPYISDKVIPSASVKRPAYSGDAGYGLKTSFHTSLTPFQSKLVPLKGNVYIPPGYYGDLRLRSSMHSQLSMSCPGVIDRNYSGTIYCYVHNISKKKLEIEEGTYIAQLIVTPCLTNHSVVCEPDDVVAKKIFKGSERGNKGFGSSGK